MKKLLFALFVVGAFVLNAADLGLLKFIPAKYEALVLADVPKLLAHPDVQKRLADPEVSAQLAALSEVGLDIKSLKSFCVFYAGGEVGVAVRLESAAKFREQLDKSITAGDGTSIAARQVNGRRIYRLTSKKRNEEVDMLFVSSDVIVAAEPKALEQYFHAALVSADALEKIRIPDVALWGMWRDLEPKPAKKDSPDDLGVLAVMASLNFSGAKGHDLDLSCVAVFRDAKSAAQMGMMIPGYLAMLSGMVFGEDPQTGEAFIKSLKSEAKDNTLRLSMHLSAELLQRVSAAAEATAKDALTGEPEPPGTTPAGTKPAGTTPVRNK